jgi:hypothetical protein
MRLKRKAKDLGGASGKAGKDHGGRCATGGAGRKKGKEKRALPSGAKWSERERAWWRRPCKLGRVGLRAGRRRKRTEWELSGPARGRKGGPRGRRPGCGEERESRPGWARS